MLILSFWVSTGLWFCNPEIIRYGGLSGVLHGMFVLAVAWQSRYTLRWKAMLIAAAIAKVLAEQTGIYDTTQLSLDIGGRVAIDAHLYGLTGGLFILLVHATYIKLKPKKESIN